jgi:hypothetical protein
LAVVSDVLTPPVRYRSAVEDSARWAGFPFRPGDIVISARSKHGMTWMQMICALLIFGGPPKDPLSWLSPWLDALFAPREQVMQRLAGQRHRRFIKTHTPLDGLPQDERVTFIVIARYPLDAAVSLYHQGGNIDRDVVVRLIGLPPAEREAPARPPLAAWLREWIEGNDDPRQALDSLPGTLAHLSDAWARRDAPNVLLFRYADLIRDLDGQMRRLAAQLDIAVPEEAWPRLVAAASFAAMRRDAERLAPDPGVLKSSAAFFRCGQIGGAREVLDQTGIDRYTTRAAELARPDVLRWLHEP